jgi:hypothetical protein
MHCVLCTVCVTTSDSECGLLYGYVHEFEAVAACTLPLLALPYMNRSLLEYRALYEVCTLCHHMNFVHRAALFQYIHVHVEVMVEQRVRC